MMPARLTSSLLVRRDDARPSGGLGGRTRSLPADGGARPAAASGSRVEILVPPRRPAPATAGSGRPDQGELVNLSVRIDRALHTRLRIIAARQRRTNQDIVRCALEAYLEAFAGGCTCAGGAKPKA